MSQGELGRIYRDGEAIFREGDDGHNMFVIQAGKVRITKKSDESDIPIVTLDAGEIFGEMALFDRLPRSATATAEGEARVLSIDKKKLFSTISKDPTVVLKILESMSGTIRRLSRDFTALKEQKKNTLQVCMNTDEVCGMILGEVRRHIRATGGAVMLVDADGASLTAKAVFVPEGTSDTGLPLSPALSVRVLETGRPETTSGNPAEICVPLKCDETVFGLVGLSREGAFSVQETELLGSFAAQASIALKNAISISGFSRLADEVLSHAFMAGPV